MYVCACITLISIISPVIAAEVWKATEFKRQWYHDWEICIHEEKSLSDTNLLLQSCKEKHGAPTASFRCHIGGERNGVDWPCAGNDSPLYHERPHLMEVIDGFDDPTSPYLVDFFNYLSRRNGVFGVIGDSQMRDFIVGIICELQRINILTNEQCDSLGDRSGVADCSFPINNKMAHIKTLLRNRPYFLNATTSIEQLNDELASLRENGHERVFILVNIGTHYGLKGDRNHGFVNSRQHFWEMLQQVLPYLNKLVEADTNLSVMWMETPPQHFNTSNGYYDGSVYRDKNRRCVPLQDASEESDWRNYYVHKTIRERGLHNLQILPLRKMMIPLYREHWGLKDCTHYCWWPMLHQVAYSRMREALLGKLSTG
jgi:hypothetical protein